MTSKKGFLLGFKFFVVFMKVGKTFSYEGRRQLDDGKMLAELGFEV